MAKVIAELIRKPTRAGDSFYFVGVSGSGGEQVRLSLFYIETRLDADGTPREIWELRAEPLYGPASRHEVAPRPSRRVGAARDQRPSAGSNL
jgi:hypothetical protein